MLNTRRRDDPASDRGNSLLGAALASKRTGPGIFLFSQECHLLFANKQALQFNQRLSEAGRCQTGQGLIAPSIIKFSEEVSASLRLKPEPKDWETYKLERIAFAQPHSLLLRGIEISRIRSVLILIETMREQQHAEPGFRSAVHLTERQRTVLSCLARGMTNKEIANQIGLSEHTVRDPMKLLMRRAGTSTRTGLLARIGFKAASAAS